MDRTNPFDWYSQKDYRDKLMLERQLLFQYSRNPNRSGFRKKIIIQPIMIPPNPMKRHATPGDYYGCFSKHNQFNLTKLKKVKLHKKKKDKVQHSQFIVGHPMEYFSPYPKAMSPAFRKVKKIHRRHYHKLT